MEKCCLFVFYSGGEVIGRVKKRSEPDLKEGFFPPFFPASMITPVVVRFSCVYCVFNQSQTRITHTLIANLKRVFPICLSKHMFVYMKYTEEAVI